MVKSLKEINDLRKTKLMLSIVIEILIILILVAGIGYGLFLFISGLKFELPSLTVSDISNQGQKINDSNALVSGNATTNVSSTKTCNLLNTAKTQATQGKITELNNTLTELNKEFDKTKNTKAKQLLSEIIDAVKKQDELTFINKAFQLQQMFSECFK